MSINNLVILDGHATRDAEIRFHPVTGAKFANFSVGVNQYYKDRDSGERKSIVTFVNCVVNGPAADVMEQYLKKGTAIKIQGNLRERSWEQDGKREFRMYVRVEEFSFGPKRQTSSAGGADSGQENPISGSNAQGEDEDDIPF